MVGGEFDLSESFKGNTSCKKQAKIPVNASKSKGIRRYFKTSGIVKWDKAKGNKNVIEIN